MNSWFDRTCSDLHLQFHTQPSLQSVITQRPNQYIALFRALVTRILPVNELGEMTRELRNGLREWPGCATIDYQIQSYEQYYHISSVAAILWAVSESHLYLCYFRYHRVPTHHYHISISVDIPCCHWRSQPNTIRTLITFYWCIMFPRKRQEAVERCAGRW